MEQDERIPDGCLSYYITSGGRIWGVKDAKLLDEDAQKRREVLGNSFASPMEAALAKAKIEAWARLSPYANSRVYVSNNGVPIMMVEFVVPDSMSLEALKNDVELLAKRSNR